MKGRALVHDAWSGWIYLPVLCLCDGITCARCKEGAIHRPISNRFDEANGTVLHIPHFGYLFPCIACRRAETQQAQRGRAGPG